MNFNNHSELLGKHAFLSPSQYSWLNYSVDKLNARYVSSWAQQIGTALHDISRRAIQYRTRLSKSDKKMVVLELMDIYKIPRDVIAQIDMDAMLANVSAYVKDAIGYKMTPEQPLYFSRYCFGTADAISFEKKKLRIHDLKTGYIPAHMDQLEIYAALFCLEYKQKPHDISTELRIYQSGEIQILEPDPDDISNTIKIIRQADSELAHYSLT